MKRRGRLRENGTDGSAPMSFDTPGVDILGLVSLKRQASANTAQPGSLRLG